MMRPAVRSLLLAACGALTWLAGCRPLAPAPDITPGPSLTATVGADATVNVYTKDNGALVDIISPRGIGHAQVTLPAEIADQPTVLRFHLQGLEQARLDNGAEQLEIAVASHAPYAVTQTLVTTSGRRELAPSDPWWAPVELVPATGAALAIPLHGGYIDVRLPSAMIDPQHAVLDLQWIDFYR